MLQKAFHKNQCDWHLSLMDRAKIRLVTTSIFEFFKISEAILFFRILFFLFFWSNDVLKSSCGRRNSCLIKAYGPVSIIRMIYITTGYLDLSTCSMKNVLSIPNLLLATNMRSCLRPTRDKMGFLLKCSCNRIS